MLSKHEISEYYSDPEVRTAIIAQIKNRPVLAVNTRKGKTFIRKNAPSGKPIQILQARNNAKNPNDLAWYTERRYADFHPTIGRNTKKIWVDIDPGPQRDFESLKPIVGQVEDALNEMPEVKDTRITYSGGRGFHVRGSLKKRTPTDSIRETLNEHLKKLDIPEAVFTSPKGKEVRLDTSTLHNKGALRAAYSINSETGRVAVPLTQRELRGFQPEQARVTRILKEKEFAPGIPRSKRVYAIPEDAKDKQWTMSVQEHRARKAGRHWDLRLVDPETGYAHSWAVPKARFPEGTEKVLAVHTPTHTEQYALNFGDREVQRIGSGYGSGTVKIVHKEPVKIVKSGKNSVQFERILGEDQGRLMLFKTKGDAWLLKELEKKGSVMRAIRDLGYRHLLEKLGVQHTSTTPDPAPSETPDPLEVNDEGMPVSNLVTAIAKMDAPDYGARRSGKQRGDTVEQRLNRDVQWSAPQDIPRDFMDGQTTMIPGGGF
jgi:DNA primase